MSLPRPFERLTLLKQVARGGMGEVFLATAGGIDGAERPCVVKIIRREHAGDKSFLARFLDEARIQAQLHHPGIAQVLEASTDSYGKPYVMVEYIEGKNLGEVRARAGQLGLRIGWPEAVALGVALGEALAHVHERTDANGQPLSIVHRDLSPQNVMVGYAGEIKLIDFGTARGENRRCHTVAGIVFAKPGYIAPEVANNTPGAAPADIYALGIMLWELLSGRRFLSGEAAAHMAAVGAGERNPPPLAEQLAAPLELDSIITRLTAARIEDRYESARQATTDLVDVLKRAPSLADGERGVRARIAHLMRRLYPAEPARSRAEFASLVASAKKSISEPEKAPASATPSASALRESSLLAGTRYRLLRQVGQGGMGVVYEAVHIDLGRTVAIKVLPNEHAGPEFGDRLGAEARSIAALAHENLVRLYDFGISADGEAFYVMERLEGESIEHLHETGMDWREAFRLGIQACRALEAAHSAGVVHRDIKPGNLFLTRTGVLKLLDFGVAKAKLDLEHRDANQSPGAIALVGTPEYMAPEQVSGKSDERSDLYALGVVLYELVTGRLPHRAENTIALLDAKTRIKPEPPGLCAPKRGLSHMVDHTLLRALERDPAQRFQNASEMREALEHALREPELRRRRRRRLGLAAITAIAIAIGGVTAFAGVRPDVRARASVMLEPLMQRFRGAHASSAEQGALVAAKPAENAATLAGEQALPAAGEALALPGADEDTPAAPAGAARLEGAKQAPVDDSDATESAEPADDDDDSADQGADKNAAPAQKSDITRRADMAPAPTETKEAKASDDIARAIEDGKQLMALGKRIKGFNQIRRIGRKNGKDPRALKAWSEAAAQMKGWGEAARVAKHWASVDTSADARLNLARMQRAIGEREQALKTLARLIEAEPSCEEARSLLKAYSGDTRVALRR